MRCAGESDLQAVLVRRLCPYKRFCEFAVPKKGVHRWAIRRVVNVMRGAGFTHVAHRCDREISITSMIDEACKNMGRTAGAA